MLRLEIVWPIYYGNNYESHIFKTDKTHILNTESFRRPFWYFCDSPARYIIGQKLVWLVFQKKNTSDSSPWRAGPLNNLKETVVGLFLKFGDSNTFHVGRVTESYWWILSRVLHAFLLFSIPQQTDHSFCNNLTHFVFVLPFNWWVNKYKGSHKLSAYYQNLDIINSGFQWFIDFKYVVGNSCP